MIDIWTVEEAGPDALKAEARRIESGTSGGDRQLGLNADGYDFKCPGNAEQVLRKAQTVMAIVNEVSLSDAWPTDEDWSRRLPSWFVEACKQEDAEDETRDSGTPELSEQERAARYFARKWKLTHWTSWMNASEREWLWWSAQARDPDTIHVVVDRLGDPSNLGSPAGLWWLFAASGAIEYEEA